MTRTQSEEEVTSPEGSKTAQEWMLYPLRMGWCDMNSLRGERIAASLDRNRHLWRAVQLRFSGFTLRELAYPQLKTENLYADGLFIVPQPGCEPELETLPERENWCADEVDWHIPSQDESGYGVRRDLSSIEHAMPSQKILRVWWD